MELCKQMRERLHELDRFMHASFCFLVSPAKPKSFNTERDWQLHVS